MYAWLPRLQRSNYRAGEELLCEREPRNTKDSNSVMPIALAVEIYFAGLIFAVLLHPRIPRKFPHREINCNYGTALDYI